MPIMGYNILSVDASRNPKNPKVEKIDVSSTVKISSLEERSISIPEKMDTLGVGFEFTTEYKPGLASIKFTGEVVFVDKDSKSILKIWNKTKKLPEEADLEIKNFLFRKCLTLGMSLSQELQLPPPLVFPVFTKQEESPAPASDQTKYIG